MRKLPAILVAMAIVLGRCKSDAVASPAARNALPVPVGQDAPSVLIVPYFTLVGGVRSSKSVSVYKVDAVTGGLTLVAGSPFAAGLNPTAVALAPRARFAYVLNKDSANISAYKVNAKTGALTRVPGSPFALPDGSIDMAGIVVDPGGKYAYVASGSGVSGFSINAATGALKTIPGSPFATTGPDGLGTASIGVDPSGKFAYVLNYYKNTISAYAIGATGGLKLAGSPLAAGQNSNDLGSLKSVTIGPKGKFAYVTASCCLYVYAINSSTGTLTASAHLGLGPPGEFEIAGFAIDPTGKFAYVLNGGRIYAYGINAVTGKLKGLSARTISTSASDFAYGVTIDPTGTFAYVFNDVPFAAAIIYAYRIRSSTGELSPLARSPFAVAASTADPIARWFNAGRCATFNGMLWSDAHPPPVAKSGLENLNLERGSITPGYSYDPTSHVALFFPRGDSGGTIILRESGDPPAGVTRHDLSKARTTSGIKLGSRAETVVRVLGEPRIVTGCNQQRYVYLGSRDGEPLAIEFTIAGGHVIEISEDQAG